MAKKKKRLSRKQLKEQRQAAIDRRREQAGWKPRRAKPSTELVEDMLPLLAPYQDRAVTRDEMEQIMMPMLDSGHLIEEPEFDDIVLDPMQSVIAFIEIGEELGLDPQDVENLSDEERDDQFMEILERTTKRLVTKDVRRDILAALDNLRRRLKASGPKKEIARVAMLQSFLTLQNTSEFWSMVGLVQAIIQRSTTAGFELMEASGEVPGLEFVDEEEEEEEGTPTPFVRRLITSSLGQKAESVLKSIPGIKGLMTRQVDQIWKEGLDAIAEGELYLELYTEDELMAAAELMGKILGVDPAADPEKAASLKITQDTTTALISGFEAYITELFTPERLDQLRRHIHQVVKDRSFDKKWLSFVLLLEEDMAADDAPDHEIGFLIRTLFGELRTVMKEATAEVDGQ
jgi:hypothetical protein